MILLLSKDKKLLIKLVDLIVVRQILSKIKKKKDNKNNMNI